MDKSEEEKLSTFRDQIDEIDSQLLGLFNNRAEIAQMVAEIKKAHGGDELTVFYRPDREAQILDRIRAANRGPLSSTQIDHLFKELIACCRSLEQQITIAYLGPAGTYTEAAALKQFGHLALTRALMSIDEVFREVEAGSSNYGIVPVENTTDGMVKHTADCLMFSDLKICAELEMPIHQAFLVPRDQEEENVEIIYSHEQSLAQCRTWLRTNYPGVQQQAVSSNAAAAKLVSESVGAAAIAGEIAAKPYNLVVKYRNIEDSLDNKTRFLVLGREDVGPSGRDKTSILVSTRNEPGALFRVLEPFHRHNISLSRIEARPSKMSSWTYVFFIDFDGHRESAAIRNVLTEVENVASELKTLGSYPKADD